MEYQLLSQWSFHHYRTRVNHSVGDCAKPDKQPHRQLYIGFKASGLEESTDLLTKLTPTATQTPQNLVYCYNVTHSIASTSVWLVNAWLLAKCMDNVKYFFLYNGKNIVQRTENKHRVCVQYF